MAFPDELSVARLRGTWMKVDGTPSPGILSIAARQYTGIGDVIITPAPFEVRLTDGHLDVPVPVGDDADLSRPLYLDITARINGTSVQNWTVQVTADDVETVTENGAQVKVVHLNRLLAVDGIPLVTISYPTAAQVQQSITDALAAYTRTADLGRLIRDQLASMVVAGPGISVSYDATAGLLIVTNTGAGSGTGGGTGTGTTPTSSVGFGLAAFGTSPFGGS